MPKKGCVFNNPQLFAWADFKTKLPTQYWEWRCHVVWPSHCELTKTLGQTIVVGAYFLATVTKILIFFDNLWIIAVKVVKVKNWIQNPSLCIGFGSRLVKIREWQWTLRTYQRATTPFLTFRVYLTADREIFLSQDGWAYELFQGPLRLKGDAHFDPWPGRSRQNHTSLQIASKYIRLPAFSEFNGIGIIFFRK